MERNQRMRAPFFSDFLILSGLVVVTYALLADLFHAGTPGFGGEQLAICTVGAIVVLTGAGERFSGDTRRWNSYLISFYMAGLIFMGVISDTHGLQGITGLLPEVPQLKQASPLLGSDRSMVLRDISVNILGFLPLGYLLLSCLTGNKPPPFSTTPLKKIGIVILFGLGLSLFIEAAQYFFVAGRYSSVLDWLANGIGTLIGAGLHVLGRRWDDYIIRLKSPSEQASANQP